MVTTHFKSATSTINVLDSTINVVKTYEFLDGDTVNLSVNLPLDSAMSLADMQKESVLKMVVHLETLIPPR